MVRKTFITLGKLVFFWGFLQIILIGAARFGALPEFYHSISGTLLALALLVMLILSIVGKLGGRIIGLTMLAFLLVEPGAGFLVHYEGLSPFVRALHPVFGIGSMFLAQSVAKRAES